jgi:dihydrofolate reductase
MGDTTYYSLKGYYKDKPLPYGTIYVASINKDLKLDDAIVINDLDNFLKTFNEELWVCGGATIYKLSLPYADNLYISFIKGKYEGNRYFPAIPFENYELRWEDNTERVKFTLYSRK